MWNVTVNIRHLNNCRWERISLMKQLLDIFPKKTPQILPQGCCTKIVNKTFVQRECIVLTQLEEVKDDIYSSSLKCKRDLPEMG